MLRDRRRATNETVRGYRVFQLGLPAIFGAICLLRVRHVLAHPPPRELVEARFASLER